MSIADPMGTGMHESVHESAQQSRFFSFVVAYVLGFVAIAALIYWGGFWEVIARSRMLSGLIEAGIIPLAEDDPGIGGGVPNIALWIRSQEPVVWALVIIGILAFIAVALLKGLQFHYLARFVGIVGNSSDHMRAYLYGNGVGRMLPFRAGEVAWAAALGVTESGSIGKVLRLIYMYKGFVLFELAIFSLLALLFTDILTWATSLIPPLAILFVAWLVMRKPKHERKSFGETVNIAGDIMSDLWRDPVTLSRLVMLSLVSFALVEFASYIVPQAFATLQTHIIHDEMRRVVLTPTVIIMAVVGGYIARLIHVTPGGIGQFEWAMALVFVVNGLPMTAAVVATLLISLVRYFAGALLYTGMLLSYGVRTDLRQVLSILNR
jgi:uncharacterized membrane protein YbhN (UPF0104 family)